MPARQASQGLLAVVSASVGTHLAMHTFSKSQSMKKHVCHPWIVAAWLMLGQTVHAQAIDTTLDKYLVLQSQINASTCAVSFAQNGASGNLVVLLPPLKTTALNNDIFSPITRFDIDLKNQFTSILCDSNFNASMQLVFDGAMAAIAPRSGLLRNTALQRPAQNVFVQIGLIDATGGFVPLDLNQPQPLNEAMNSKQNPTDPSPRLTLGVRYVTAPTALTSLTGADDVSAGNVAVFLPFLLKLN